MTAHLTVYQRAHVYLLDNANDELLSVAGITGGNGIDYALRTMFSPPPEGFGFAAIKIKMLDGVKPVNGGVAKTLKQRRDALGLRFVVGGWSQNRVDPVTEAEWAHAAIGREGLDMWEACCEFEYKGDPGSEQWLRSGAWTRRFRELRPGLLLGLVGMPNEPAGHFYDWQAWRLANARWVPECYPGEFPQAPSQWPVDAQAVAAAQFFRSYVHPAVGLHQGQTAVRAGAYVGSLRDARAYGFSYGYSVYAAHYLTLDDWLTFGEVNRPAGTADALAWYPPARKAAVAA